MVSLKKVSNADSGTADIVGGDDWDTLQTYTENMLNGSDSHNYIIYKSGSTFYAQNKLTKNIDESNSEADTVIKNCLVRLTGQGGTFEFSPNTVYIINSPLVLPQSDNTNLNQWRFLAHGVGGIMAADNPSGNTVFKTPNDSGLDGRSFIECIASIGGAKRGNLICEGLSFYNANFLNFDMGGIDLAADNNSAFGQAMIKNCNFRYCDRGIHLAGYFYHTTLRDLNFGDANTNYIGSYDIKIEKGGYPDKADFLQVDNIHTTHICGTSASTGHMDNEFYIESNYSTFSNLHTDGWTYTECPFKIVNSNANTFFHIGGTDLNGASGTAVAALYLTATGSGTCSGNRFYKCLMAAYPPSGTRRTVLIDNAAVTNNYIELEHFGQNEIRIDESAGSQNVFALVPGFHSLFTQAKPIIMNLQASSRVIDQRGGAVTRGTATKSGDGTTTAFTIAHNCYAAPSYFYVNPTSTDARGLFYLSADATNITVTYSVPYAPPVGSSNLTYVWEAVV